MAEWELARRQICGQLAELRGHPVSLQLQKANFTLAQCRSGLCVGGTTAVMSDSVIGLPPQSPEVKSDGRQGRAPKQPEAQGRPVQAQRQEDRQQEES